MDKPKAFLRQGLLVPWDYIRDNPGMLAHFTYSFKERVQFGWDFEDAYTVEKDVHTFRRVGEHYEFARGDLQKVYRLFGSHFDIVDQRSNVPLGFSLSFVGRLKEDQKEGLKAFINPNLGGLFVAAPGYGKTVVMTAYVTLMQLKTLLLVNKVDLKDQFIERLRAMTNIDDLEKSMGQKLAGELHYKNGKAVTYPITVTTYQLIIQEPERLAQISNEFGLVLVDECHRAPADSLTRIIRGMNPQLFMGVSATPRRKDSYHRLLPDLLGPVRFRSAQKNSCSVEILPGEHFNVNKNCSWPTIINVLCKNLKRNRKIVDSAVESITENGHRVLILTDRVEHCDLLHKLLKDQGIKVARLYGVSEKDLRKSVIERLNNLDNAISYFREQTVEAEKVDWLKVLTWEDFETQLHLLDVTAELLGKIQDYKDTALDCLVATSKLFAEGSDIPCISHLFMVTPTANDAHIEQAIGRVQREFLRKQPPKVTYLADSGHGLLYGCAKKFRKTCTEMLGYTVEDASSNIQEDVLL